MLLCKLQQFVARITSPLVTWESCLMFICRKNMKCPPHALANHNEIILLPLFLFNCINLLSSLAGKRGPRLSLSRQNSNPGSEQRSEESMFL